jgi:hypothetical protein
MQEIDNPEICVSDSHTEIAFMWDGFDGDDCFTSHKIQVRQSGQLQEYDFGLCVVWGLRKLTRLVESEGDGSETSGFRNPEIMTYELKKTPSSYELVVECEVRGLHATYRVENPRVQVNRDFLNQYDT